MKVKEDLMINWKTVLTAIVTAVLLGLFGYAIDFQRVKAEVSNLKDDIHEIKADVKEIKKDVKMLGRR